MGRYDKENLEENPKKTKEVPTHSSMMKVEDEEMDRIKLEEEKCLDE